jgi:hypothetical protein
MVIRTRPQSVVSEAEIHNTLAFQQGIGRVSVKRTAALWLIRKEKG